VSASWGRRARASAGGCDKAAGARQIRKRVCNDSVLFDVSLLVLVMLCDTRCVSRVMQPFQDSEAFQGHLPPQARHPRVDLVDLVDLVGLETPEQHSISETLSRLDGDRRVRKKAGMGTAAARTRMRRKKFK